MVIPAEERDFYASDRRCSFMAVKEEQKASTIALRLRTALALRGWVVERSAEPRDIYCMLSILNRVRPRAYTIPSSDRGSAKALMAHN